MHCLSWNDGHKLCISIELYEIVQLRSGDSVALSLIVGVVGLTLSGGGPLIRLLYKKIKITYNIFCLYFSQKNC